MPQIFRPKLAMCNIFSDLNRLKEFAFEHGFTGIDWSFDLDKLPNTPQEESVWVDQMSDLQSLEIRYHCPFYKMDLGHENPLEAEAAEMLFRSIIRLVAKAGGKYLTIHIGLGRNSTEPLSWERTVNNLTRVVQHGASQGVRVCLENLASGWTSRPDLFEKLIRKSGAGVTIDIGHAHAAESIRSHHYVFSDFAAPHPDLVSNAHIYHTEVSDLGHLPPKKLEDIKERLAMIQSTGCQWWVLEVRDEEGLLETKRVVDEYLTAASGQDESGFQSAT